MFLQKHKTAKNETIPNFQIIAKKNIYIHFQTQTFHFQGACLHNTKKKTKQSQRYTYTFQQIRPTYIFLWHVFYFQSQKIGSPEIIHRHTTLCIAVLVFSLQWSK